MLQQLTTMLEMQDRMNRKVHPDWIAQDFAWYRALWIECGELIEHYGYKWWKHQQPAWEHVRLEIVDIWHFGMSMRFDGSNTPTTIAAAMLEELRAESPRSLELSSKRSRRSPPALWSNAVSRSVISGRCCRLPK